MVAGYYGIMLKTVKTCQLRYFIEHMVPTIESHKRRERRKTQMIEENRREEEIVI